MKISQENAVFINILGMYGPGCHNNRKMTGSEKYKGSELVISGARETCRGCM